MNMTLFHQNIGPARNGLAGPFALALFRFSDQTPTPNAITLRHTYYIDICWLQKCCFPNKLPLELPRFIQEGPAPTPKIYLALIGLTNCLLWSCKVIVRFGIVYTSTMAMVSCTKCISSWFVSLFIRSHPGMDSRHAHYIPTLPSTRVSQMNACL